jgi:hypothetical protein
LFVSWLLLFLLLFLLSPLILLCSCNHPALAQVIIFSPTLALPPALIIVLALAFLSIVALVLGLVSGLSFAPAHALALSFYCSFNCICSCIALVLSDAIALDLFLQRL